jgi:hypothetical protein
MTWWQEHQGLVYLAMFVVACILYSGFPVRYRVVLVLMWLAVIAGLFTFAMLVFGPDRSGVLTPEDLVIVLLGYAAALYAILCDLFRFGFAHYLTERRGTKWVKELDYPYLLLGAVGLLASLTKLDLAKGHTTKLEVLGPILVASAIVIRLIKTRAEVGDWNKL